MPGAKNAIVLFVVFLLSFFVDIPLREFFKSIQNPYITQIMLFVSSIQVVFLIIFLVVFFIIKKRNDLLFYSLISLLISSLIVFLIKSLYFRPRPFVDIGLPSIDGSTNSSFPSGHVNRYSSLLPFFWLYKNMRLFIILIVILVAISRMYLQAHYLSDVIFGFMIGYYTSVFFLYLSRKNNKLNRFLSKV